MPIKPEIQCTLVSRLLELGFDEVRIAAVTGPLDERHGSGAGLRTWIEGGMHGEMKWMERSIGKRLDSEQVLSGARSVIVLGVSYAPDIPPRDGNAPRWARYVLNEDYHETIRPALVAAGRLLEEICGLCSTDYRYYVDTGPVLERSWAARSGTGFVGKNSMLISRRHGNWLFLATILTRAEFVPDAPMRRSLAPEQGEISVSGSVHAAERSVFPSLPGNSGLETESVSGAVAAHGERVPPLSCARPAEPAIGLLCGKCTRCLDACPTNAFVGPGVLDARRCISYQTIENKAVIPRELRPRIGNRIFGCDICLEVCPWNRFARAGRRLLLVARGEIGDLSLSELLALTPARFSEVFRRTSVKRIRLAGLLRNACVVAGNSGDTSLLPRLIALATEHESSLVRAHAVWAVFRLGGAQALSEARTCERDPIVESEYDAESWQPPAGSGELAPTGGAGLSGA